METRHIEGGRRAEEENMVNQDRSDATGGDGGSGSGEEGGAVGPIAWLEDIESPETALPAWVLAKIDRAVVRYGSRWTAEQTAAFRRQMAWTLATHPRVRQLVEIVEAGRRQ